MLFRLAYLLIIRVFGWLALLMRSGTSMNRNMMLHNQFYPAP